MCVNRTARDASSRPTHFDTPAPCSDILAHSLQFQTLNRPSTQTPKYKGKQDCSVCTIKSAQKIGPFLHKSFLHQSSHTVSPHSRVSPGGTDECDMHGWLGWLIHKINNPDTTLFDAFSFFKQPAKSISTTQPPHTHDWAVQLPDIRLPFVADRELLPPFRTPP
jgi:hypothetical protein